MSEPLVPAVNLGRRHFGLSLLSAATLAACGAGQHGTTNPTQTRAELAARNAVSAGLVGAAIAYVSADAGKTTVGIAGLRLLGADNKLKPGDVFAMGSNTKAMSAAVIANLVDRGFATWDTRVADALPELRALMRTDYAGVSLEHLLAHRGGLLAFNGTSDDEDRFSAALGAEQGPLPETLSGRRRYFATRLLQQTPPPGITPEKDFHYSNAGYALAATMMEALTGQSFETLFEAYMTSILGVKGRWRMSSEVSSNAPAIEPVGHEGPRESIRVCVPDEEEIQFAPWLRVLAPAGFWVCTAADYAHWLQWHLRALQGRPTPLPSNYLQRLSSLAPESYAMGWMGAIVDNRPALIHTGHVPSFMCEAVLDQAGQQAVFGVANNGHFAEDGSSWVLSALDRRMSDLYARSGQA